jgi:ABC-type nickel/cobalt efflux system permease component RcnA
MIFRRVVTILTVALAALAASGAPEPVLAHPLGNFTVNRYARLELTPQHARIRYVLDMAEIPTFQAMPTLDANRDGAVSESERASYGTRRAEEIARGLTLTLEGVVLPLRPTAADAELLPGQGGLQTLRVSAWLDAPAATPHLHRAASLSLGEALTLSLRDANDPSSIGWREMLVVADGLAIAAPAGTALPTIDVTDELRRYPEDLLQLPLDVRAIASRVTASAPAYAISTTTGAPAAPGARASLERAPGGLTGLVTATTLTPTVILGALLAAAVFGGLHAMSPGHGKTIVASYLVGTRGTARHALFLGLTVTLVHTAGVYALLLVTLFASRYLLPEQLFPWMGLASGALVLAMGVSLALARLRSWRAGVSHDHGSGSHSHGPGAEQGHSHAIVDARGAITWRQLLALGVSGGLLPCPSATVLGLGAIALGRVAYGLVLILAFSAGLAGTLVAAGLLAVYSGRMATRVTGRLSPSAWARLPKLAAGALPHTARVVPIASASVIALAGLALTIEALGQLGAASVPVAASAAMASVRDDFAGAVSRGPGLGAGMALLGTALVLGLRHGIDWDHIAAISDIAGTASMGRRAALHPVALAFLYAAGHALVVMALGMSALRFGALLPEWLDPLMERAVGATLVFLSFCVLLSLGRAWRSGGPVRLQSRWMLLLSGVRRAWRHVAWLLHGHRHHGAGSGAPAHRLDSYGPGAAFGTGVIHGIGAETGTQVLLIAAVGGAAAQGLGTGMLLAFVAGLLLSNTGVAVLASLGFTSSRGAKPIFAAVAGGSATLSLVVGALALVGMADHLPDLQMVIVAALGAAPV